jgi:hypothetical protein
MSTSLVVVAAWSLILSLIAIWGITYALRFFAVRKEGQVVMPGRLYLKSAELSERGQLLWKIRNALLVIAVILMPILWSLKPPA